MLHQSYPPPAREPERVRYFMIPHGGSWDGSPVCQESAPAPLPQTYSDPRQQMHCNNGVSEPPLPITMPHEMPPACEESAPAPPLPRIYSDPRQQMNCNNGVPVPPPSITMPHTYQAMSPLDDIYEQEPPPPKRQKANRTSQVCFRDTILAYYGDQTELLIGLQQLSVIESEMRRRETL